ncbi:hypothetical protein [Rhizobium sp. 2MFCol3.1]|uniref:hypothetical protein n=1 Tax=Rhizobium sp. 2MFCol3.1 TaxID=1246459 RepID=UPI00037E97CE|nr:hypothetical protein [Rhizobium sp. 2MFCol3.1]
MGKRITVELSEESYRVLSEHAAEAEMSVEKYAYEVIEQYLEDIADMEVAEAEYELLAKDDPNWGLK